MEIGFFAICSSPGKNCSGSAENGLVIEEYSPEIRANCIL